MLKNNEAIHFKVIPQNYINMFLFLDNKNEYVIRKVSFKY